MNPFIDPIPVIRKNGLVERIPLSEITSNYRTNPVIEFGFSRPDFNSSFEQFVIASLQFGMPPGSKEAHKKFLRTPPSSRTLKKIFPSKYFDLLSNDPRPLQGNKPTKSGYEKKIGELIPETPRKERIKDNRDFFISEDKYRKICLECAFISVYMLQARGPMGGPGHYPSSCMTALGTTITTVRGRTLWESLWSNVILKSEFTGEWTGNPFFWDKKFNRNHALSHYFERCRTIYLIEDSNEDSEQGICDICGQQVSITVSNFIRINYKVRKFKTPHPLCPYKINDKILSYYAPGRISTTKNWPVYTTSYVSLGRYISEWIKPRKNKKDKLQKRSPAPVIASYLSRYDGPFEIKIDAPIYRQAQFIEYLTRILPIPGASERDNFLKSIEVAQRFSDYYSFLYERRFTSRLTALKSFYDDTENLFFENYNSPSVFYNRIVFQSLNKIKPLSYGEKGRMVETLKEIEEEFGLKPIDKDKLFPADLVKFSKEQRTLIQNWFLEIQKDFSLRNILRSTGSDCDSAIVDELIESLKVDRNRATLIAKGIASINGLSNEVPFIDQVSSSPNAHLLKPISGDNLIQIIKDLESVDLFQVVSAFIEYKKFYNIIIGGTG